MIGGLDADLHPADGDAAAQRPKAGQVEARHWRTKPKGRPVRPPNDRVDDDPARVNIVGHGVRRLYSGDREGDGCSEEREFHGFVPPVASLLRRRRANQASDYEDFSTEVHVGRRSRSSANATSRHRPPFCHIPAFKECKAGRWDPVLTITASSLRLQTSSRRSADEAHRGGCRTEGMPANPPRGVGANMPCRQNGVAPGARNCSFCGGS